MEVAAGPAAAVLTVTENGYGKRTRSTSTACQSRGGVGIINIQTTDRNGQVVGVAGVTDDDELMLITQQGMMLRTSASRISLIGRATQGVRLIDIEEDDRAVSLAWLEEQEEPESTPGPTGAPEEGSDTTGSTEATD